MSDDVVTPERPSWQRPPFEPGHELSMRHGAYSPRKVDPLARDLVAQTIEHLPQLGSPQWAPAMWAWARAEAQAQLLVEYLAKAGEETGDGIGDLELEAVRAAYLLLHRAEARADRSRSRLGLDPLSAARLGRDKAAATADMARVMAELERQDRQAQAVHAERVDQVDEDGDDVEAQS